MSMLEAQHSAVERLQGERDGLRVERDTFRVERDAANAEVEKLQLIIKQLLRSRYGRIRRSSIWISCSSDWRRSNTRSAPPRQS